MWSRRRRRSSTGCRCCERRRFTTKARGQRRCCLARASAPLWRICFGQRPRGGACRFAQPVHRSDAGPAGTREDRRAVAARPAIPHFRSSHRRPPSCRSCAPRPRRCCACTRTSSSRHRTARRPRSRCCSRSASRCCASPCRRTLPASARRPVCSPAHARRAAAWRGAARRDGRQARRAAASGPCASAPWSGNRAASPRGRAR